MAGRSPLEPGAPPDDRAGPDEQLPQDGDRVGFGMRSDRLDDGADQPLVGVGVERFGPAGRGGQPIGRLQVRVGAHSASISAMAALAAASSTMALPDA